MPDVRVGDKVRIYGFECEVVGLGTCDDEGCNQPTITVIDPEGAEDTVHLSDCE